MKVPGTERSKHFEFRVSFSDNKNVLKFKTDKGYTTVNTVETVSF